MALAAKEPKTKPAEVLVARIDVELQKRGRMPVFFPVRAALTKAQEALHRATSESPNSSFVITVHRIDD